MERSSRGKSPLHGDPHGRKTDMSSNHRASLEKDIEELHLRLQQEKTMRIMLERAMGRVSSTLSPGHRNVAVQTKELIDEIELLEEEVASREQHVLSLYRSIFENCVSSAPSRQSSGMTSPAHSKAEVRKHPSIISSTFCSSSKKMPLQPFQALASIKEFRNRNGSIQSKSRHSSMLSGQINNSVENRSDPNKVDEKVPNVEKPSFARTLKDHLYECPSKLSEELVRCMAAIYCWLQTAASIKPEKKRSPLLSRSSTNVVLPRRSSAEGKEWSSKSTLEISSISTDKDQFSQASYAINSYRVLVEQLERVNPSQMGIDAQIAFWINVYNSLIMHAYLAYGIPQRSLRRIALFHKAAYNIGGYVISVNAIEQSVFGMRSPRTGRWFETIISTAMRKKAGESKDISSRFALRSSPLLCFALCTGASSDPVLKVYTATNIREELEVAVKEFLQANVVVKKSRKVFLPKLLERYAKEACLSSDDLLNWVAENVDKKLHDTIRKCIDCKSKKASLIIEWLSYNTRFQYKFAKELTEKPWWV
ncbi:hypothetical protein AQUCO_01300764v1 [Aquilegia coerulea]|nr:hypothetical protein AQUCO_01300764v1 [Aquilegia coerulea]